MQNNTKGRPAAVGRVGTLVLCLLGAAWLSGMAGCSTLAGLGRRVVPAGSGPQKRVLLARFVNQSLLRDADTGGSIEKNMAAALADACRGVVWINPGDPDYPFLMGDLPEQVARGALDNLEMAQMGRQLGLNAIITPRLVSIEAREERGGLPGFRGPRYKLRIVMGASVFDTETGAKLLEERFSEARKIDDTLFEEIRTAKIADTGELAAALDREMKTVGEKVCEALAASPWKGFVVAVEGDKIILSAGENAGVQPGMTFSVYASGPVIAGTQGQRFRMQGEKTGEIRVTAVFPAKSEAVLISGPPVAVGDTVRRR